MFLASKSPIDAPSRLAIYDDAIFFRDSDSGAAGSSVATLTTGNAFMLFCFAVGNACGGWTQLGRVRAGHGAIPVPTEAHFVDLPNYPSLTDPIAVAKAVPRTVSAVWKAARNTERVWVMGPHPVGLLLALAARLQHKPVVLGVRQETMEYHRSRAGNGASSRIRMGLAWLLDRSWKLLARRSSAVVVGERIAEEYSGRGPVLSIEILLAEAGDLALRPRTELPAGPVTLLTVGRIDSEKNPLLMVDAIADLERSHPGRFHLRWIGTGPMRDDVSARIAEHQTRGVEVPITLVGFVAPGQDLFDEYRSADVFVHVSLTEGVPQVLMEAMAFATPIVATDVGGVRQCLRDGTTGLLVAPNDRPALVDAISRMSSDRALRAQMSEAGLTVAANAVLAHQARRVADFIAAGR